MLAADLEETRLEVSRRCGIEETVNASCEALAEAAAMYERQRTQQRQATQDALMQLALQNMSAYGTYAGERFGSTLGATEQRAATAAQIREALA